MWEEDTVVLLDNAGQPAQDSPAEHHGPALNSVEPPQPSPDSAEDDGGGGGGGWLVVAAALVAASGGILFGYDVGVMGVAMLPLRRQLQLTCTAREALVSAMMAGALVASAIGGIIIDSAGRKVTIIINALLFMLGSVCLAASHTLPVMLLGRVVVGFAVSLSAVSECIYISEIAPPRRRGMLVSLNEVAITAGFLLSFLAGHFFLDAADGWRWMLGLSAAPALLQALTMMLLPPTPHFLLLKRKDAKAQRVLRRLTGREDVRQQLAHVRLSVEEQRDARCGHLCSAENNMGDRLMIGMGLVFFQQFTGQPNVLNYAPTVLQMVGFCGPAAATAATVGVGVVKVVATVLALLLVDRAGRRTFLLAGILLMAACLLGLAGASRGSTAPPEVACTDPRPLGLERLPTPLPQTAANVTDGSACDQEQKAHGSLRYMALVSLMGYVAAYGFGFGPITWLVLSEIYPAAIKGRAVAAATSLNWLSNMIISATFLQAVKMLTVSGMFLGHAGICLLSAFFVYFAVPETRGRSLHEISEELSKRSLDSRARSRLRRLFRVQKQSPPQQYRMVEPQPAAAPAAADSAT